MIHDIKSILIVGGGSSGWMTAAAIAKRLPNIKLSLIESTDIPTIGVGESTLGHINRYLHLLGLQDADWMPYCNATYKTSIKFQDFRENPSEKPHVFHYPFGLMDSTDKPRQLMEWFLAKVANPEIDPGNFAEFYHDSIIMAEARKMTNNIPPNNPIRAFDFRLDTAYHMDAGLFGVYLRDHICKPAGTTHIVDTVIDATLDEQGAISGIVTENSGILKADLYIDCTGFKSMLLEQKMGVPFKSFHDTLQNDSAIATVIPYIDPEIEMDSFTTSTAIECGWVWNIPLWHRIGTGYVYSSQFATEAEAEAQFRKHLKSNRMTVADAARADAAEFRHIQIKHGVHTKAWEKNVIGIGLSNGFIEPLESTGLMLTHETIIKLIAALGMRNGIVNQYDVDLLNHALMYQISGFKDFISLHYAMSKRCDTPYWKQATGGITYSPGMNDFKPEMYSGYISMAHSLYRNNSFSIDMGGIMYIAAGMGYLPLDQACKEYLDLKYMEVPGYETESYNNWLKHKAEVEENIKSLPTHRQFLATHIHK
jgi:hypothetical protein